MVAWEVYLVLCNALVLGASVAQGRDEEDAELS